MFFRRGRNWNCSFLGGWHDLRTLGKQFWDDMNPQLSWVEFVGILVDANPYIVDMYISIWVFPKIRVPPKWMIYNQKPIKMDDLGVPLFSETPIYVYIYITTTECRLASRQYVPLDLEVRRQSGEFQKGKMKFTTFVSPLKFNMEPKKKSPEKKIPLGNHHFQIPCYISGV